jgi:hypothetical protein
MTTRPPPPTIALPIIPDGQDDGHDDARVSRFDVERYVCGELPAAERARVEAALRADPALQAFHDDVIASDRAFLIAQPPAAFMARLPAATAASTAASSAASSSTSVVAGLLARVRQLVSGPTLAAACAATAVVFFVIAPGRDAGDDGVRSKGGDVAPALGFFVRTADGARLGHAGEALRAGDQIQLAPTDPARDDAAPRALVVLGVDAAGAVSVYAADAVDTARTQGPGPRLLPASLVLDDTDGDERFFAVWGDDVAATRAAALEAAEAIAARVRAGASPADLERLPLRGRFPQSSFHIRKAR